MRNISLVDNHVYRLCKRISLGFGFYSPFPIQKSKIAHLGAKNSQKGRSPL